ncbi:MAG: response regulator, partial [Saprospiraceae bacterium]|nr:response regulator [Saprospiraceae bacterium]
MCHLVRCCLLLLFVGIALRLPAQAGQDSAQVYVALLEQLVQGDNFEQAQVEAQLFRSFLQRHTAPYPAQSIPLLSSIYRHNKDEDSALDFLAEAGRTAASDPDPTTRVSLLQALIKACTDWKQPELAFATQQQLAVAQDSLAGRERLKAIRDLQSQLDSLAQVQRLEKAEQDLFIRIERSLALWLALGIFTAFFVLLVLHRRSTARWRKHLAKKDLENDFLRSDRFTSTLPVENPGAELEAATPTQERSAYFQADDKRPDKTALLIEPNRQIVLYLKSLLSDRFELETAGSASEGLLMASNHMPDLIVCDAVLNGKTGIEVIRQIKLSERTNHIPVILLSERHGNEGKLDALRAGA